MKEDKCCNTAPMVYKKTCLVSSVTHLWCAHMCTLWQIHTHIHAYPQAWPEQWDLKEKCVTAHMWNSRPVRSSRSQMWIECFELLVWTGCVIQCRHVCICTFTCEMKGDFTSTPSGLLPLATNILMFTNRFFSYVHTLHQPLSLSSLSGLLCWLIAGAWLK